MNTRRISKSLLGTGICAALSLAAVMLPSVGRANLILNGSFELPAFEGRDVVYTPYNQGITNWTLSFPTELAIGGATIHHTPNVGDSLNSTFNFAQDGNYYLDLSGAGFHATIYQDFATVPGTLYELSFYIGASNDTPPAATINVKLDGVASLLNATLTPNAPATNIDWSHQTFTFTADSSTTRLTFLDVGYSGTGGYHPDDNASFVDNVSVTPVPEPSTYGAILGVAMLCLVVSRRYRGSRRMPQVA